MSGLETISFKISKKLATDLKKKAGNNQSDFIRQAIQEKLSREVKEDETLNTMVEQIKNMDPLALHGSLSDLVYTAQVIFKEVKKQNELLKLMHESASLAGTFAYEIWKEEQTEEDSSEWFNAIIKDAQDEIKKIDL
jgi:hypothetical protein